MIEELRYSKRELARLYWPQTRKIKIGKNPGVKKFVMRPDLYIPVQEKKVFSEASTHSGINAGVIKAAWDAAGEVIRTWATIMWCDATAR